MATLYALSSIHDYSKAPDAPSNNQRVGKSRSSRALHYFDGRAVKSVKQMLNGTGIADSYKARASRQGGEMSLYALIGMVGTAIGYVLLAAYLVLNVFACTAVAVTTLLWVAVVRSKQKAAVSLNR
jgi:Flp pilus assembly protein TadB